MNYSNRFIEDYNNTKRSIINVIKFQAQYQEWTQKELLAECHRMIDDFMARRVQTPKVHGSVLRGVLDTAMALLVDHLPVYLYNIDGKFYKTNTQASKHLDFPLWDTLPREQWNGIANYGGLYWPNSLKPFYVNPSDIKV